MKDRARLQEQREFQDDWPCRLTDRELDSTTHWFKENFPSQRKLFAFPEVWS